MDKPIERGFGFFQLIILLFSIYSLISLLVVMIVPVSLEMENLLNYIDNIVCLFFLFDFAYNLIKASNKLEYMKWGWIDLLSSIPMYDFTRAGRIFRIFRLIRLLRAFKSAKILASFLFKSKSHGALLTVAIVALLALFASSIAILEVENKPECTIKTAEDALWWSYSTMTTVGYGDKYPITTMGRLIAAVLMTVGVAICGTFTAYIASWFMERHEKS
jgi:voltage-gated potassium channel